MSKLSKGFVIGVIVTLVLIGVAQVIAEMTSDSAPKESIKMVSPNGVIWKVHVENSGAILADSVGCYQ